MDVQEHVDALRREAALLHEAVIAAPPDAPVPSCPDWQLRDMVRHLGGVHRWARAHVAGARLQPLDDAEVDEVMRAPEDDAELPAWVAAGAEELAVTLETAPAGVECWSFLPAPSPLAFWARRQAHETGIHRVDAQLAAGRAAGTAPDAAVTRFPADLAADGVDEILCGFASRRGSRLRSDRPALIVVEAADAGRRWTVDIGAEGTSAQEGDPAPVDGRPRCCVRGAATDLFLLLWNRRDAAGIEVVGDPALLELWRTSVLIRWT